MLVEELSCLETIAEGLEFGYLFSSSSMDRRAFEGAWRLLNRWLMNCRLVSWFYLEIYLMHVNLG